MGAYFSFNLAAKDAKFPCTRLSSIPKSVGAFAVGGVYSSIILLRDIFTFTAPYCIPQTMINCTYTQHPACRLYVALHLTINPWGVSTCTFYTYLEFIFQEGTEFRWSSQFSTAVCAYMLSGTSGAEELCKEVRDDIQWWSFLWSGELPHFPGFGIKNH